MKLNLYEKIYAYGTTWAEMAIEKNPVMSAIVSALIVWAVLL